MLTTTLEEQLVKYLADAHAIEQQALVQMRRAPQLAGPGDLADAFRRHQDETAGHERMIAERLAAHGARPSRVKDEVMKAGGVGFALFAQFQPDTPGKLAAHAYSYEHLELAAYELLERVAQRAGEEQTAKTARAIAEQEQAMADRLQALFPTAVARSLEERGSRDASELLKTYLADAHALEQQSIGLLKRAPKVAGGAELRELYEEHLAQTETQRQLLEDCMGARGASPSGLKDAAMRLGAISWSLFFRAQPDTHGKFAAFAFAFEHLEIAAYEQLALVAHKAGDEEIATMVQRILEQERETASRLRESFDLAIDASLDALAVPRTTADAAR